MMTPKDSKSEEERKRLDRALDRELEATFPASDPPSFSGPTSTQAGTVPPV